MDEQPDYRKNVYLLTAIAYKKLDKLDSATAIVSYLLIQLSRGLKAFPEDYDCLVYRAKLHMRMNEFQRAADDFLCWPAGKRQPKASHTLVVLIVSRALGCWTKQFLRSQKHSKLTLSRLRTSNVGSATTNKETTL
jgi:hypothetical protein